MTTVPLDLRPSCAARRSEITLRFAPVSIVKGKGPLPLTLVISVMRPAGSVAVASRSCGLPPKEKACSGEARLCAASESKAATVTTAMAILHARQRGRAWLDDAVMGVSEQGRTGAASTGRTKPNFNYISA